MARTANKPASPGPAAPPDSCPAPAVRPTCRDHLLDAAEEVVVRSGIGSLTLDAVAAHAKVSKGGLLYHFPSKDALLEALVARICGGWRSDYTEAVRGVEAGPGRTARGLMSMCIAKPETWTDTLRRSSVVLVAALANNPRLIEPLRRTYRGLFDLLAEDGEQAGDRGELVVLALNGLWFEWIFGLQDMSPRRLEAMRRTLTGFVNEDGVVKPGRARRAPARAAAAGAGPGARTKRGSQR